MYQHAVALSVVAGLAKQALTGLIVWSNCYTGRQQLWQQSMGHRSFCQCNRQGEVQPTDGMCSKKPTRICIKLPHIMSAASSIERGLSAQNLSLLGSEPALSSTLQSLALSHCLLHGTHPLAMDSKAGVVSCTSSRRLLAT